MKLGFNVLWHITVSVQNHFSTLWSLSCLVQYWLSLSTLWSFSESMNVPAQVHTARFTRLASRCLIRIEDTVRVFFCISHCETNKRISSSHSNNRTKATKSPHHESHHFMPYSRILHSCIQMNAYINRSIASQIITKVIWEINLEVINQ
jgi:hypothetical protein